MFHKFYHKFMIYSCTFSILQFSHVLCMTFKDCSKNVFLETLSVYHCGNMVRMLHQNSYNYKMKINSFSVNSRCMGCNTHKTQLKF